MKRVRMLIAACLAASVAMGLQAEQGQAPASGARGQGGARGAGPGDARAGGAGGGRGLIGGTLTPAVPD
ncbi:MAG TPA: hypothetical protein VNI78_09700, partial [Vicinamibacterales bacterium]|nr:hypothetical protein [Vicinamibacterales bacterium]